MRSSDALAEFVRDGLRAGHSGAELRASLGRAGWPDAEIEAALSVWIEDGLRVPVPRPRPSVSGRDLVMFGLFAVALVTVIWHVVQLAFALIDTWLPDPELRGAGWHLGSIRWSISALVVVLPLLAWLTWRIERAPDRGHGRARSSLQQRFGALAVLLSFLSLIGNAIAVIYAGLSGDLTASFLAKAGVVAVVAGLLIAWFRAPASEA